MGEMMLYDLILEAIKDAKEQGLEQITLIDPVQEIVGKLLEDTYKLTFEGSKVTVTWG